MKSLFSPADDQYGSVSFPVARPFQDTAHAKLREGFAAGHKNQLIMAPTGAGKSYLGLRIVYEALLKGKKAVFVCDRTTLIEQTSEVADRYGLRDHGILQAQHVRRDSSRSFQIASIQTIDKRGFWPDADVVVIDEAHTQHKAWTEFVMNTKAAVIGLSATPFSCGLGKLFSNLINATNMHDLTESGVLVPMRVFSCTPTNMKGASTSGGEWTDKAAEQRGMEIIGDVVSEWSKFGQNRKTIVFGATINHCEELARQFNEAGIFAAVFTSKTSAGEREMLLKEYRKNDSTLRVLISVEALAKGFDVPDVGCVVDCRPLRKSLSTAIQMWGRGLRSSPDTGKKDCILLDHSGNIHRFLDDYTGIFFNGLDALDMGEKLDKTIRQDKEYEPKGCPSCGFKPFASRCMSCGFEMSKISLQEHIPGEAKEIFIGKKKLADDRRHLWEQVCTYSRLNSQPAKQHGRAWNLFRNITGSPPPKGWTVDGSLDVEISRNVINKIKSLNIAYVKGRNAA